jgi:hypothetical protein
MNSIQKSFERFQSYDELILSKIKEYNLLIDANPENNQYKEDLAMWNEIFESRKGLLPAWNNAVKFCDSLIYFRII